jgi:hypothetical protein
MNIKANIQPAQIMFATAEGFNKLSKPENKVDVKKAKEKENDDNISEEKGVNATQSRPIGP